MQILDDHSVNLRAARIGRGEGRIYTIWLQAIDAAENISEPFPVEVTVPHDQRRKVKTAGFTQPESDPGAFTGARVCSFPANIFEPSM